MTGNHNRAAIYLRVSRDDQTTENQRLVLVRVAEHRGWIVVQTYEDQGISGAKGRDQRPAFDQMLRDVVRRRFDVLMVWSIDRLGRSVLHVANALAELDAAGVALYSDQQAIDSTTPMGRAMIQMASVFGEQERHIIRSRVNAGLDRVRAAGKEARAPDAAVAPCSECSGRWSGSWRALRDAANTGCHTTPMARLTANEDAVSLNHFTPLLLADLQISIRLSRSPPRITAPASYLIALQRRR